jgi:glyoxylase-like metal-dependent hydrolase (beta-lactamase superfamily II)
LKDDLYVIEGTSNGANDVGNVTIYVTSEGVILVDDRFDQDYADVVAAVKKITALPVRYVINTHHHGDHTGSNARFLPAVEIIAHANARKHMIDGKMPGPPHIVFTSESDVFLGGKEVRVIYNGRGHTDGDVAVYFPAARAVALGDLLAGTRGVTNPVMDYASGGSIRAWPATLDGVLKLDVDIVIPGHGAVTTKDGLIAHRNKVAAILSRAEHLVRENRSKDEISKLLVTEFDYKPINLRSLDGMIAELKN